jgi:hypothetical protein
MQAEQSCCALNVQEISYPVAGTPQSCHHRIVMTGQHSLSDDQPAGQHSREVWLRKEVNRLNSLFPSAQLSEDSLSLLDKAVAANAVSPGIIDRLVLLSCSDSELSQAADDRLTRILAAGNASASVYNLVGTSAVSRADLPKAKRYLERAYSLKRERSDGAEQSGDCPYLWGRWSEYGCRQ